MTETVFNVLNGWIVGGLCALLTIVHLLRPVTAAKNQRARLKGIGFAAFAGAFFLIAAGAIPDPIEQRAILRALFALFLINELAYHVADVAAIYRRIQLGIRNGIGR